MYFPAERWHQRVDQETSTRFHRPEPPRRASTLPPRDSLLREGVPGCVHPPWDMWDRDAVFQWLKLTTPLKNRPWDQATQAVNMVMGKPTINGSFTGKIIYKWWFVNLSDGKKFDFLQTCLHRSAKVCHQQFLWISDPWEQDPASEPYPKRPSWSTSKCLGMPWRNVKKSWVLL